MNFSLSRTISICKREMHGYFASPPAYVFIVIFLILSGFVTFNLWFGGFFERNEASLSLSFFRYHPLLFLLLVPAIAMRLWSEELKSGTVELLFTMPVSVTEAVIGKFVAAWSILIISILLTFPIIITVFWLGDPDPGPIITGYLGSLLLSGSYLAIGSLTSSMTRNQVVSFIICLVLCLLLYLIGHPAITDFFSPWAPVWLLDIFGGMSVIGHFESLQRGVLDFRDILYFFSLIVFALFATGIILHSKRST